MKLPTKTFNIPSHHNINSNNNNNNNNKHNILYYGLDSQNKDSTIINIITQNGIVVL